MSTPSQRLLVIAYEFPPAAGPGVQRLASFARHLPENGWTPRVISAELIAGRPRDAIGLEPVRGVEVERLAARHVSTAIARGLKPFKRARRSGRSSSPPAAPAAPGATATAVATPPLSVRLSRWVAVPDDAVFWARHVAEAAERMHERAPFSAVLASGPPYSALVAGADVGRRLAIPVVLDMRDAWRDNMNIAWPTARHSAKSLQLERAALTRSAGVIAVSSFIAEEARDLGASRVEVIPNGFEPAEVPCWRPSPDGPLRLGFLGRLSRSMANPTGLFAAISSVVANGGDVRLDVVGPDAEWAVEAAKSFGLLDRVTFRGFRPHAEALDIIASLDAGVLMFEPRPGSEAVYSTKLFEYLGIGIPVVFFGPENGVAAELIREAEAGIVCPYGDVERIVACIEQLLQEKTTGRLHARRPRADVVSRFDRGAQTAKLAIMLDAVVGEPRDE
jgi:glycosyltransferase involved in cell wall biosynthesis